jgi:hypothetical protein
VDWPADSLPDDVDALRALALNAIAERDAALAERARLIMMNEKLRLLLRKAQGFEAKSERLAKLHPDQLNLALEDIEQTIAKVEAIEEKTHTAAAPGTVRNSVCEAIMMEGKGASYGYRERPAGPTVSWA